MSSTPLDQATLIVLENETRPLSDVFTFISPTGTLNASMTLNTVLSGFQDFELTGTAQINVVSANIFDSNSLDITVAVDGSLTALGQTLQGSLVFRRTGSGAAAQTFLHTTITTLSAR